MNEKVFKFHSDDIMKFIKIYQKHECLWNTENEHYKNRAARNMALDKFAQEFGVQGFGHKDITHKIKILRTQFHGEKKKIRDSLSAGSGTPVYHSKLCWYDLMDSFIGKTSGSRESTSNTTMDNTSASRHEYFMKQEEYDQDAKYFAESGNESNASVESRKRSIKSPERSKPIPKPIVYESARKRPKVEVKDDVIENFGKYVISSLKIMNGKTCIRAQDEIQMILSKYKLLDIREKKMKASPSVSGMSSGQESEE